MNTIKKYRKRNKYTRKRKNRKNKKYGGNSIIEQIPGKSLNITKSSIISYSSLYGLILRCDISNSISDVYTNVPLGINTYIEKITLLANKEEGFDLSYGTMKIKKSTNIQADFQNEANIQKYIYYKTATSSLFKNVPICPAIYNVNTLVIESTDTDQTVNMKKKEMIDYLTMFINTMTNNNDKLCIEYLIKIIRDTDITVCRRLNLGLGTILMESIENPKQLFDYMNDTSITTDKKIEMKYKTIYLNFLLNNYGIFHKDLHMGNIIINQNTEQIYIIDFGRTNICVIEKENEFTKSIVDMFFDENYKHILNNISISAVSNKLVNNSNHILSNIHTMTNAIIDNHNTNIYKFMNYGWIYPYITGIETTHTIQGRMKTIYIVKDIEPYNKRKMDIMIKRIKTIYNSDEQTYIETIKNTLCRNTIVYYGGRDVIPNKITNIETETLINPKIDRKIESTLEEKYVPVAEKTIQEMDDIELFTTDMINIDYDKIQKYLHMNTNMSKENSHMDEIIEHSEKNDIEWLRKNVDIHSIFHPDYVYTHYGKMPLEYTKK